ncbi:Asp-tRNA(Asn)/Glu-tRNA(Gln) amidotransferase subunit GatC [Candidatus Microgenomates bacterium]|nr:MAG: Asp-tRNA(Asn)/Glu-tRNA(Gln) amidotransferase subunit GatC [Candidatus Microgenomates bacterium]
MKIDVKHVAKLAKLQITDDQKDKLEKELSEILNYVEKLNEVDTKDVEPTFNITGTSNTLSEDKIKISLTQEEALENAGKKKNGFFVTKGVFGE